MKKTNIVIIDSGIRFDHPLFINDEIKFYDYMEDKIVGRHAPLEDSAGHGTAIYSIVRKCPNVNIINIKIPITVGEEDLTLISILEKLLDSALDIDLINLSLGINCSSNIDAFYAVCDKLSKKGIILVAAFDNSGAISYPAAFDNVIGVISGKSCYKITDFESIDDSVVNIAANGNIQRIAWVSPDYILLGGNSFACAHVTVQIAKFMQKGIRTRAEVLKEFQMISKRRYDLGKNVSEHKLFSITKAALFPFNKEMHSLVRFYKLLPFDIIDVYDSKYSATVGASTTQLLKDQSVFETKVKNIDSIDWSKFDTLILGHTSELSSLTNLSDLRYNLVSEAIRRGKKVYSFDDFLDDVIIEDDDHVFIPRIDDNYIPASHFGMLHRISKPVVGVYGTSSKQGKYTLQLKLRRALLQNGYNIGQIGTEPSALLFGMDYVFPIGYNSSVYINDYNTILYLNHIINKLCFLEKDLILVGSQSCTLPYDTANLCNFPCAQYAFLMGTHPDCVILCINPFDEMDYVKRTVQFIESSVACKVVAIVVFPLDISDTWSSMYGRRVFLDNSKYGVVKKSLYDNLSIPVFRLDHDDDINTIVDIITDFFVE